MPNGHTHLPRKDIDIGKHGRKCITYKKAKSKVREQ